MREEALFLRHHLVNWLFTPLYLLFLFSTITGYIAASKLSNESFDLVLYERANLLMERYDQAVAAGISPVPVEALRVVETAGFHFALFTLDGRELVASAPLPRPRPQDIVRGAPTRRDAYLDGAKIRLVTLRHSVSSKGIDYMVQVAEPVESRQALGRSILGNIVVPQFMFIVIAGFAVWIGLNHGFEPLERLRRQVASRRQDDLSPLDESQAPGEVQPFIREINRLLERLRAAMESQRQFVANAAHQLRTPFAGLVSQAELANREELPPATRDALQGICQGAKRCARLVNQLLALARNAPEAALEGEIDRIDLCLLARDGAAQWAAEALKKDVDLGYEGPADGILVEGMESVLSDMVGNLVDNAVRYTPSGGHVTVSVGRDDAGGQEGPWLRVEDDGPGIPPQMREKVFQRFFRLAGSAQPGSGLGLAIVREAAERLGARVEVGDSAGGRGTVFTVRFPAVPPRGRPEEASQAW